MEKKTAYRESLRTLSDTLSETVVEGEARGVMSGLLEDVQDVLGNPGELPFVRHRNLAEKLDSTAKYFEVSHPNITAVINNVITSLNGIGI